MKSAFLIDGGFYLKRYQRLVGNQPPRDAAQDLFGMCLERGMEQRPRVIP